MTAPDRIWADAPSIFDGMDMWHETPDAAEKTATEYVRADLHAALTAELAAARDAALAQDQQLRDTEAALDSYRAATDAAEAELARLMEALTPSGNTKAAYSGEFSISVYDGETSDGEEIYRQLLIDWTTIKAIMATIRARAAIREDGE